MERKATIAVNLILALCIVGFLLGAVLVSPWLVPGVGIPGSILYQHGRNPPPAPIEQPPEQ
ncbi:MAG TPA: hypothetical protein VFJ57_10125 [Solirubrobacterales bacterium]|nr:hypothetical protein [Solirubrobacterales bacterium]